MAENKFTKAAGIIFGIGLLVIFVAFFYVVYLFITLI